MEQETLICCFLLLAFSLSLASLLFFISMKYSIDHLLQPAYASFPEAQRRPVIGITANYSGCDATLRDQYYKQIVAAGGVPVIIPPISDTAVIADTLEQVESYLENIES